jgi:RHS repeat-associated protein
VAGGAVAAAFTYDEAGRLLLQQRTHGGAAAGESRSEYDAVGNLSRLTHIGATGQIFADTRYLYDGTVRLVGEERLGQSVSYSYDADWQLTGADFTVQVDESYAYDKLGNRTGGTVGPHNRLLADAEFDYTYDPAGNLTRREHRSTGEATVYDYDHRNRLVAVERRDAGGAVTSRAEYRYDGLGRVIERDVDGEVVRTAYTGSNAWADADEADAVTARYLFTERVDGLVARWRPAAGFAWYLTDQVGSVRQVVDGAGAVVLNAVEYSAFGEVVSQTDPAAGDRFAFTAREWETGAGLYHYRARSYDPAAGRFLSEDPIGFAGGDLNLYRYVKNSPATDGDPTGMMTSREYKALDAKVTAAIARAGVGQAGTAARLKRAFDKLKATWQAQNNTGVNMSSSLQTELKLVNDILKLL